MTTPNEAKEAIYARFLAQFTEVPNSRVVLDNEELEHGADEWVRVAVRQDARRADTVGETRSFRSQGSVFVQCFVRANTGTRRADIIAKDAADALEGAGFGGVNCFEAVTREVGVQGRWYQIQVEVRFDFFEQR